MLNEDDVLFGLWKRRGAAHETRAALSCIQHGMLVRGQDFLEEAINKNQAGAYQSPGELCGRCAYFGTDRTPTSYVQYTLRKLGQCFVPFTFSRNITSMHDVISGNLLACVNPRLGRRSLQAAQQGGDGAVEQAVPEVRR